MKSGTEITAQPEDSMKRILQSLTISLLLAGAVAVHPASAQTMSSLDGQVCSGPYQGTGNPPIIGGINFAFRKDGDKLIADVRGARTKQGWDNHASPHLLPNPSTSAVELRDGSIVVSVPQNTAGQPGLMTNWTLAPKAGGGMVGKNDRTVQHFELTCSRKS
jgi:hypothetical protein